MTAEEWVRAFAEAAQVPAPDASEVDHLLELAAVAARGSERRAAPLTCWLAARANLAPAEAVAMAKRLALGQ